MRRSNAGAPVRAKEEKRSASKMTVPAPDAVNEQVVIAAALVNLEKRKRLVEMFTGEHFFAKGHPEAWALVEELERRGLAFDPATAKQLTGGKVDVEYLIALVEQRPEVPPNLQHHVGMLRWDKTRVDAIKGPVGGLVEAIADPLSEPEKVLQLARASVATLEGHSSLRYLRDPARLVEEQMAEIAKRTQGLACYPFGLDGFDVYGDGELEGQYRIIPGAAPGKMTVVVGTPGSGKSTFTARLAIEQANQGRRVLYAAWEQGSGMTLELCAGISLGLSRTALSTGRDVYGNPYPDAETMAKLRAEMDRLSEWIRFMEIPFDRGRSEQGKPWELNARHIDTVYEYLSATGAEVAIFDLWRRMLHDIDPDAEEQGLYRQQAMLQATRCHGILIQQLRAKDLEQRADKRPTREAIKGSAAWFEVPDTLLGVHREFLWKAVPDDELEVLILKQRFGVWPLSVRFTWDADRGFIGEGRSAEYVRPGAKGAIDGFLDGDVSNPAQAAALRERRKEGGGGRRRIAS